MSFVKFWTKDGGITYRGGYVGCEREEIYLLRYIQRCSLDAGFLRFFHTPSEEINLIDRGFGR